jgi:hypothetical protein
VGRHWIAFGESLRDLASEPGVQPFGLVDFDEFLELTGGIRFDARPFRLDLVLAAAPALAKPSAIPAADMMPSLTSTIDAVTRS